MITIEELKGRLTPQQQAAAHLLVANEFAGKERRSQEELAEEIGISRQQLHSWRTKNNDFITYQAALSDMALESHRSFVDGQLMKLIRGTSNNGIPSVKAVELFYKLSGKLIEKREVVQHNTSQSKTTRITSEEVSRGLDELNDLLN